MRTIAFMLLLVCITATATHATIIRYEFVGTVTNIDIPGQTSDLNISDGISGYFEYNDSMPIIHDAFPSQVKVEGEFFTHGFNWNATPQWLFDSWFDTSTNNLHAFLPVWDGALDIYYDTNSWRLVSDWDGWTAFDGSLDRYEPMPEPATLLLLGAGLIGIVSRSKKFSKIKKA